MIDGVHVMVGQSAVSVQGRMRYSTVENSIGFVVGPRLCRL